MLTQDVADKKATIERLRAEIKDSEEIIAADTKRLKEAPPLPDDVDTKAVVDQISAAKAVNANAEAFARRAEIVKQAEFHEGVAEKLTEAMDARKTHKKAAIAAAKMPVEGLSLDEDGVMLNGRPFEQASDAERLRVSVAVAMAGDPTIRVLRVRDGERLDKNGLKLLAQMAKKANFQIFLEKVSDDGKTGVVLVEGRVESVNPVPV